MVAEDRRSRLLELVRREGFTSLPDLAESLAASESTVRRNLAHLEQEGTAQRTPGRRALHRPVAPVATF